MFYGKKKNYEKNDNSAGKWNCTLERKRQRPKGEAPWYNGKGLVRSYGTQLKQKIFLPRQREKISYHTA